MGHTVGKVRFYNFVSILDISLLFYFNYLASVTAGWYKVPFNIYSQALQSIGWQVAFETSKFRFIYLNFVGL